MLPERKLVKGTWEHSVLSLQFFGKYNIILKYKFKKKMWLLGPANIISRQLQYFAKATEFIEVDTKTADPYLWSFVPPS